MCSCEKCCLGEFSTCLQSHDGASETNDVHEDEIAGLDEDDEQLNISDEQYEFVEPGSYIALLSAPNSFEQFIICEIKEKGIASKDMVDFYGHVIWGLPGKEGYIHEVQSYFLQET